MGHRSERPLIAERSLLGHGLDDFIQIICRSLHPFQMRKAQAVVIIELHDLVVAGVGHDHLDGLVRAL